MKIGIIDADLIGRKKHYFPNLVCMKLSAWHKKKGDKVFLLTQYYHLNEYDRVYIAKVFTDTPVPDEVLKMSNVIYGGTGFFYDKAVPLMFEIEQIKPDYHLYDDYVKQKLSKGQSRDKYKYYLDYSIGFATRGCFRKCPFCVNRNSEYVTLHSNIVDWVDKDRKKICLLDDNVLGAKQWQWVLEKLIKIGKPFQFKQGLDERLLTHEKLECLRNCKLDGDLIFAFDNLADKNIITSKLELLRIFFPTKKNIKFYVLCGFDRNGKYDKEFWINDIHSVFERIKILANYGCKPYIMRFAKYKESPFKGTYINLASWCNQPNIYAHYSYQDYCLEKDRQLHDDKKSSTYRYYEEFLPYMTEDEKTFQFKGRYNYASNEY